jgi:hypothetical protein
MDTSTMTDAEYRLLPAINYSNLKHLRSSPLHYRQKVDAGPDPALNEKLAVYRAIHTLVLEPFLFEEEYAVCSMRRDKRTKKYQEFLAENERKSILSEAEHEQALAVAEAVNEHPWVQWILGLDGTSTEQVLVWEDRAGTCKGKADIIHYSPEHGLIVADLKTTKSTDAHHVRTTAGYSGWHLQFAHYLQGAAKHYGVKLDEVQYRAFTVVAEAAEPHDVSVVEWGGPTLDAGFILHRSLLDRLRDCEQNQAWPGRAAHQQLDLPDYLL